jgi:hypothetical protein
VDQLEREKSEKEEILKKVEELSKKKSNAPTVPTTTAPPQVQHSHFFLHFHKFSI